jgi:hypothetical protein
LPKHREGNLNTQKGVDTAIKPPQVTFELYKLLIEENRHLHSVWIDNFRVVITFNSFILAGAFALLTMLMKQDLPWSNRAVLLWALRAISVIGVTATMVGIHIVRRTKAITGLRQREIKHIENVLGSELLVSPFSSGAVVLGISDRDSCAQTIDYPVSLEPLRCNPTSGLGGYVMIAGAFVLTFALVLVLSIPGVVR